MNVTTHRKLGWLLAPKRLVRLAVYAALLAGGLVTVYPLLFALVSAFYERLAYLSRPDRLLPFPSHPILDNFRAIISGAGAGVQSMLRPTFNSIFRTVWLTAWPVLGSFMAGYAFARLRFRGKNFVFWMLLSSQVIPGTVTIVPLYIFMARWPLFGGNNLWGVGGHGLLDSYAPLLILGMLNIMGIFLMRQSILAGPLELEEAAKIDGCGVFRIMFSVVAPIQKPVLGYLLLIHGIGTWNDWFTPFFFTHSEQYQVLPSVIARLVQSFDRHIDLPNFPLLLALGVVLTIPSLIILAFFQRYIVEGVARIGIKG